LIAESIKKSIKPQVANVFYLTVANAARILLVEEQKGAVP
jgi:hypothetical protein